MNGIIGPFPCGGPAFAVSRDPTGFRSQCMDIAKRLALLALTSSLCCSCVPRFAYVIDSEDDSVSVYAIDAGTGRLSSLGYYPTGAHPSGIVLQLDGKFAFVANQGTGGNGSVSVFAVDPARGSLQRLVLPLDAEKFFPRKTTAIAAGREEQLEPLANLLKKEPVPNP